VMTLRLRTPRRLARAHATRCGTTYQQLTMACCALGTMSTVLSRYASRTG
jgi:hypothetical protein